MNISFYAPFKPLGHHLPSGDLVIGAGLYRYLQNRGHHLQVASNLRTRWIFWKPWLGALLSLERRKSRKATARWPADLWLTYHSYYKGPDMLGPSVAGRLTIPYVIFQGAYATKWRKRWHTRTGFYLNRKALLAADHVFANKRVDYHNLLRLLPEQRVSYTPPGIYPEEFAFNASSRRELRRQWNVDREPVIVTAAMFRKGVKTESLTWVVRICGMLRSMGRAFRLVIIGDGPQRHLLQKLAAEQLPDRAIFAGKVPRDKMHRYLSAGDVFVFPGIGESLGMVYLEAQSCGLPVVAFDGAGVPEVVRKDVSGLLLSPDNKQTSVEAIDRLLVNKAQRREMGQAAAAYIRQEHDLQKNYRAMENKLVEVVESFKQQSR